MAGMAAHAQDYLSASGTPSFVSPEAVEQGFTDAANGNLHLEFVFGSYPQRAGQTQTVKYVYDSNMVWGAGCSGSSCSWAPSNSNNYGWRMATAGGTITGLNYGAGYQGGYADWAFTDVLGTTRYFHPPATACPVASTYATDSSGYMLNICQEAVYAPDGTNVWSTTYMQQAAPGVEDSNGNYVNPYGTDMLGRTLFGSTMQNCTSNQTCYQVPNSQGGMSTYTVTTATISVTSAFHQSGITDCTGCTMNVVQSIGLPDGTSYSFKYDCDSGSNPVCSSPSGQGAYYGLLTSMTLPTGGTVSYAYTNFSDSYSNKAEWLSSRSTVGGTWSYQPQVLSTCSSTQVGCQQKVTVTAPSGDYRIYTFTLNNGAWPVTIQNYDASSTLLSTTSNTYDFSQACVTYNCHGAAFIRLTNSQTTVSAPSGSLTKQASLQYDSPQTGNITAKQEWGYYPGSFPGVPDRATYTQYLSTGTNDINRPTSVTVCNNSGSDSACPGGGTRVVQTLYTYDNYSACSSGLVAVTGAQNHDDGNFGTGYTARGNPTLVQQWVSGSSYLNAQLCYDTTGQVTRQTDPNGNVTTYSYADQFYSDNGTNSLSSYVPSKPTNAYVTSVTQPLIGTSTFGYYYGSGKQAYSTDPNGATAYSHFMDPFDRSTENDYALTGWDKSIYTSPTQTDVYLAVADTTPSSGCQSCQHSQILLDGWGRKTSEKIANYPAGTVSSDTSYDINGRVYSGTHPYQGGSPQYEYYHYDGLDRTTQQTHPDNQYASAFYGPAMTANGGLATQLGSATTYGYGYPVLYKDEAGNQRQEWFDGLGRLIEVDEPMSAAAGSVTVGGSEQSKQVQTGGPTQATATINVTGGEQHWLHRPCTEQWQPCSVYDSGDVYIFSDYGSYSQGSTPTSVATSLSSAISGDSSSPVTVTSQSGASLTLTTKASGNAANISFSTGYDYDNYDTNPVTGAPLFTGPSFQISPSSGAFSGGHDATYGTRYDSGTATITVAGHSDSYAWGSGDNTTSIAAGLAAAINADSSAPVTASASGTTVTVVAKDGSETQYSLSASTTYDTNDFGSSSFSFSNPGSLNGTSTAMVGTYYAYDAADHVMQVVQGIQTRGYAFDGLGRATSVTTPEAGTENFSWTGAGSVCSGDPNSLCQKTDARGVVTNYYYDSLNRLVGKSYTVPSGVAPMPNVCTTSTGQSANTCFVYDQGGATASALGRKTQMIDPSGSESYAFDKAGRITQLTKVIGPNSYTIGYQYNAADEITQTTYPSGRAIQRSYNNVGQLCEIANATSSCGSSGSPYATGYAYNAAGQLTNFNYGNGVSATFGYSTNRSQLTSLLYVKGSNTLLNLSYWYQQDSTNCPSGITTGNNGQIQCITDSVDSGRTVSYGYDPVGRLTSALTKGSTGFPQWGLAWTYDRYGNRLGQSVTAGSGYQDSLSFGNPGGAQTNRPDGWCFDASGNLQSENPCPPASPIVYDGENHMTSDPNAGATYGYDGNGLRVQKCVSSSCTVFIYADSQDIAEYDNGALPTAPSREFVYTDGLPGPSGLLASITGGTTTYFHPDHLGWRVSTDANGSVYGQQGAYPFGQSWYSTNGNQFVFTNYQRDSESGLDYAFARYYDSSVARFCSVDPLGGQINDPQTLNLYAYGRNDPINITDPTGQGFWGWFVDALLGIADYFSGGALTPALLADTAHNTGSDRLLFDAIAAAVEIGMQTTPQGQNLQKQPQKSPPTPCFGMFYVMRGNPRTIGHRGAMSRPVTKDSAAVDPEQWGAKRGSDMRGYSDDVSGDISTPGYGNGHSSFGRIRDVVNNNNMRSGSTGAQARAEIRNRVPDATVIELPGLGSGPHGRTGDPSSLPNHRYKGLPGILYVPSGRPCPDGTIGPPGVPSPPAPSM